MDKCNSILILLLCDELFITLQRLMERISLSRTEKAVLRHVCANGGVQPMNITPNMFLYTLSTLQEKGLVQFRSDYDEVTGAKLTIKGRAYLEQNPKLTNPIDWKSIITIIATTTTAIATTIALFVACSRILN